VGGREGRHQPRIVTFSTGFPVSQAAGVKPPADGAGAWL
jgi:hypothetical protein